MSDVVKTDVEESRNVDKCWKPEMSVMVDFILKGPECSLFQQYEIQLKPTRT